MSSEISIFYTVDSETIPEDAVQMFCPSPISETAVEKYFPSPIREMAKNAYNICTYLLNNLKTKSGLKVWNGVFAVALCYFHRFIAKNGIWRYCNIHLAAACFFLACKAENCVVHLSDVVQFVFEVRPKTEDYQKYKKKIVNFETMLCDCLDYDFRFILPLEKIALLSNHAKDVGIFANKLYSYICISSIAFEINEFFMGVDDIAAGLVLFAAECLDRLDAFLPGFLETNHARYEELKEVVLEVLFFMKKITGVEKLDNMVMTRYVPRLRKKRPREWWLDRPQRAISTPPLGNFKD